MLHPAIISPAPSAPSLDLRPRAGPLATPKLSPAFAVLHHQHEGCGLGSASIHSSLSGVPFRGFNLSTLLSFLSGALSPQNKFRRFSLEYFFLKNLRGIFHSAYVVLFPVSYFRHTLGNDGTGQSTLPSLPDPYLPRNPVTLKCLYLLALQADFPPLNDLDECLPAHIWSRRTLVKN